MIKVDIIKRLNALEQRVERQFVPNFIMIYYDDDSEDFVVDEHYDNGERHSKHINHYKNYVFHPKFEGVAILDLKSEPKNYVGDLHQIRMKEFREEHDLINCGITLEAVLSDTDGKLEQSFLVTVVTRI